MNRGKTAAELWMLVIVVMAMTACNKSERGCLDQNAENFEPSAKIDCGCCYYTGKALMYYNSDYYFARIQGRVTSLNYFIDGVAAGKTIEELEVSVYNPGGDYYGLYTPSYQDNIILFDLGNQPQKNYLVTIKDENGTILYSKNTTIVANKITLLNL
ncbi:MAG: hypothetical protein V4635_18025 [Bacteroidota bacterium]